MIPAKKTEVRNRGLRRSRKAAGMKKAFVFSLDILIAVVAVILIMSAANRHVINAEPNRISSMQMSYIGSDITAMLDYKGVLQTLNEPLIESEMNDMLPSSYNMLLKIVLDDGNTIYVGEYFPGDQPVLSGTRFFAIKRGANSVQLGYATYQIWRRPE